MKLPLLLSILVLFVSVHWGVSQLSFDRFYVFEPVHLQSLVQSAIHLNGNDTRGLVEHIVADLQKDRSLSPYLSRKEEWVLNNAGGAMGAIHVLHASLTEYLLFFHTPLGTEGHTGRFSADNYCHILTGTQTAFAAGSYEAEVYPAGSVHHLRRGDAKQFKGSTGYMTLGYARGWIPSMSPFGYADGVSSTLDWTTLWKTTRIAAQQTIGNLLLGKI